MSNLVLENLSPTLPWDPLPGESNRLRVLMIIMLLLALLIWLVVPHVKLPQLDRAKAEAVPESLARVVLERKKLPPEVMKQLQKLDHDSISFEPGEKFEREVLPLPAEPAKTKISRELSEPGNPPLRSF